MVFKFRDTLVVVMHGDIGADSMLPVYYQKGSLATTHILVCMIHTSTPTPQTGIEHTHIHLLQEYMRNMARRRLTEAERWQFIGMRTTGMSFKDIGRRVNRHYTVISRLVRKHLATNDVKDLQRSGRPRITSPREDRALVRLVRRQPFYSSTLLKPLWLQYRRPSLKTLRNRLREVGLASRLVIKRPWLTPHNQRARLQWCLARRGWNLRTWRRIHWSDESMFLLHVTDGRTRVWRQRGAAYTQGT